MNGILFKKNGFTKKDICQIIGIHRQEIGQGFLSSLGDKALELIFSLVAESESGILIIAKDISAGRARGFVCGTTHTGTLYRDFLLSKSFQAVVYLAPKLLSPTKSWKAFETLMYPAKRRATEMPSAELLDIAVDAQYQGKGLARLLFHQLVDALGNKGVEEFKIIVGEELIRARRFYEKLGADKVASIQVHRGEKSLVYIYKIVQVQHSGQEKMLG